MLKDNKIKISKTGTLRIKLGAPNTILYFSGSDGDWNNLNNWYSNSSLSNTAGSLPSSSNSVILLSSVSAPSSTVKRLFVLSGTLSGIINVSDEAVFYNSSILSGTINGRVCFLNSSSINSSGIINGFAVFSDNSYMDGGGIVGLGIYPSRVAVSFNDTSYYQSGSIRNGNIEFYDSSYLNGPLGFFGGTTNQYGYYETMYYIKFYDSSYNNSDLTAEDSLGVNFYDYASNNTYIYSRINFYNYSTNNGTLENYPVSFYDYSVNSASADLQYTYQPKFYNNSINYGKIANSTVYFYDNSKLLGGDLPDSTLYFYNNACSAIGSSNAQESYPNPPPVCP
jgi:hypothetical protein